MNSCNLKWLKLRKLLLHVGVYFVISTIVKVEPKFQGSRQTLPNVLVAKLDTSHVVEYPLNLSFSPLFIFFCTWLRNLISFKHVNVLRKKEIWFFPL